MIEAIDWPTWHRKCFFHSRAYRFKDIDSVDLRLLNSHFQKGVQFAELFTKSYGVHRPFDGFIYIFL